MRVPSSDEAKIDDLISSCKMDVRNHSLIAEDGKLHTLEYYVSKATELNDMMDPKKVPLKHNIHSERGGLHIDDEHFSKHVELGQGWSW